MCLLTPALRKYLVPLAIGFAVVIGVVLTVLPSVRNDASARAGTTRSVWDRQNTDAAAMRIIEQHPLGGVGWVRFVHVSEDWVRQAHGYPITNIDIEVHNVALGRAAELGLPAAALWVFSVLAGPCLVFIRRRPPGDLAGWAIVSMGGTACWLVAINSESRAIPAAKPVGLAHEWDCANPLPHQAIGAGYQPTSLTCTASILPGQRGSAHDCHLVDHPSCTRSRPARVTRL